MEIVEQSFRMTQNFVRSAGVTSRIDEYAYESTVEDTVSAPVTPEGETTGEAPEGEMPAGETSGSETPAEETQEGDTATEETPAA